MRSLLFAFTALVMTAQPCAAQETVESALATLDPHERVYETLVAQTDNGPMIESVLDWLERELASNDDIATLERAYPGLIEQVRTAARPIIAGYSKRVTLAYRPRMIALLEADLTAAEATEIAEFYESPIGRRLVAGLSQSYRPNAVLDTLGSEERVTAADVRRDMTNASQAALQGLSAAEMAELNREVAARPAILKLVPVVPRIAALRAEMEEVPMTAEEEAAIQAAVEKVFASLETREPRPVKRK